MTGGPAWQAAGTSAAGAAVVGELPGTTQGGTALLTASAAVIIMVPVIGKNLVVSAYSQSEAWVTCKVSAAAPRR
jgi:hypothetical protein